jgi:hypothetical protein
VAVGDQGIGGDRGHDRRRRRTPHRRRDDDRRRAVVAQIHQEFARGRRVITNLALPDEGLIKALVDHDAGFGIEAL